MSDELLTRLDAALAAPRPATPVHKPVPPPAAGTDPIPAAGTVVRRRPIRDAWPWVASFLAIQFLWGALLFLPGSQAYRPIIRALPYAIAAGLVVIYAPAIRRARAPGGTLLLLFALGLLALNLLHPTSLLEAGVAQCLFQAAIAAPMFWAWKAVGSLGQLRRLLWMAFWLNTIGATLGVLQVYYPDVFMPPQFNTLGIRLNELYVESLTYLGPDGRRIVRPPGLSDQPGGAAVTGALAVVLGVGLSFTARTRGLAAVCLGSAGIGLAAIYLTQVRSLLLMSVGAIGVFGVVLFRRGQVRLAARLAITAAALVVVSFVWARAVGGEAVEERFVSITREGAVRTYQENRGGFVSHTFGELLDQYPFGAGVGRWGMMNVYFGDPVNLEAEPIHVEIQITGWLLDGGMPMWALYGGAVLVALLAGYRLTQQRASRELADLATIVFGLQVLIFGFGWAGPVFNTQLGALFWFLTSALHGAALAVGYGRGLRAYARDPDRDTTA